MKLLTNDLNFAIVPVLVSSRFRFPAELGGLGSSVSVVTGIMFGKGEVTDELCLLLWTPSSKSVFTVLLKTSSKFLLLAYPE